MSSLIVTLPLLLLAQGGNIEITDHTHGIVEQIIVDYAKQWELKGMDISVKKYIGKDRRLYNRLYIGKRHLTGPQWLIWSTTNSTTSKLLSKETSVLRDSGALLPLNLTASAMGSLVGNHVRKGYFLASTGYYTHSAGLSIDEAFTRAAIIARAIPLGIGHASKFDDKKRGEFEKTIYKKLWRGFDGSFFMSMLDSSSESDFPMIRFRTGFLSKVNVRKGKIDAQSHNYLMKKVGG